MFRGIKKLLPGHWMKINGQGEVSIKRYWDINFASRKAAVHEQEYCERLRDLLREAVRIRLISDVPLGAFLSGGMDSSTVVATMVEMNTSPVKTFSVGFSVNGYDEGSDAEQVACHLGTDHTQVILEPKDIIGQLEPLIKYFDEPFADSSLLPTYLVSKVARQKVTVALSGDGGDELFGGYPWWQKRPNYQLRLIGLPSRIKRLIGCFAPLLPDGLRGKHFLTKLALPYDTYLFETKAVFQIKDRECIYSKHVMDFLRSVDPYEYNRSYLRKRDNQDWSDSIMEYDLKTYIPNDILTKVDRMSMFCSLEARVPLLDHKIVEFAAQIPAELKLNGSSSKYILKKTMEGVLPENILSKPKHGFSVPLEYWLRNDLKDQMMAAMLPQKDSGIFDRRNIEKIATEFLEGNDKHKDRLWVLFTFNVWYASHFS